MKRFRTILLITVSFLIITIDGTNAFSKQTLIRGTTGEDVIELQSRLQFLGYYHAQIDGVFGWKTDGALRKFQSRFGLKADGKVGKKTKERLTRASQYHRKGIKEQLRMGNRFTYYGGKLQVTKKAKKETIRRNAASFVPKGFSKNDIQLMANAVHGEARGEPYIGQVAVAAVILNRVRNENFPKTISGVIFEPRAFTAVDDGQIWLTPNETSQRAVLDAIQGWDPTSNSLYYFNPDTATNRWIWGRPQVKRIGKHIFCK